MTERLKLLKEGRYKVARLNSEKRNPDYEDVFHFFSSVTQLASYMGDLL